MKEQSDEQILALESISPATCGGLIILKRRRDKESNMKIKGKSHKTLLKALKRLKGTIKGGYIENYLRARYFVDPRRKSL